MSRRKTRPVSAGLFLLAIWMALPPGTAFADSEISILGDISRRKKQRIIGRLSGKTVLVNAGCGGCGVSSNLSLDDSAFRYLSLHQMSDGAWKNSHPDCSCPRDSIDPSQWEPLVKSETPEMRMKVQALVAQFQEESIEKRTEAEPRIRDLGRKAIPELLRGLQNKDSEIRARCRDLLDQIETRSNRDYTSLSLLAYIGGGNRPTRGQHRKVVETGVKHLLTTQSPEGQIGSGEPLDHIMGTIILCELVNGSKSKTFQRATEKSVLYLNRIPVTTPREITWKALALRSATLAGIKWPKGWLEEVDSAARQKERLRNWTEEFVSGLMKGEKIILKKEDPIFQKRTLWNWTAETAFKMANQKRFSLKTSDPIFKVHPKKLSPELLYLSSIIVYRNHPRQTEFSSWKRLLINTIKQKENRGMQNQCTAGSWAETRYENRLEKTIFRLLTLHVYYRYNKTLARAK